MTDFRVYKAGYKDEKKVKSFMSMLVNDEKRRWHLQL